MFIYLYIYIYLLKFYEALCYRFGSVAAHKATPNKIKIKAINVIILRHPDTSFRPPLPATQAFLVYKISRLQQFSFSTCHRPWSTQECDGGQGHRDYRHSDLGWPAPSRPVYRQVIFSALENYILLTITVKKSHFITVFLSLKDFFLPVSRSNKLSSFRLIKKHINLLFLYTCPSNHFFLHTFRKFMLIDSVMPSFRASDQPGVLSLQDHCFVLSLGLVRPT